MGPRKETHVSLKDNRSSHRLAFCLSGWVQDWAVVLFCFVLLRLLSEDRLHSVVRETDHKTDTKTNTICA